MVVLPAANAPVHCWPFSRSLACTQVYADRSYLTSIREVGYRGEKPCCPCMSSFRLPKGLLTLAPKSSPQRSTLQHFENCQIKTSVAAPCGKRPHWPPLGVSEVAFSGRSNVGKSSLINAITHSKAARTSKTPGRTQTVNFFSVKGPFQLVDLPGFGFANAPAHVANDWKRVTLAYLRNRYTLRCTYALIDVRHGITSTDYQFIRMLLEEKSFYNLVLTKCDTVSREHLDTVYAAVVAQVQSMQPDDDPGYPFPRILCCSAKKNLGIEEVRESIMVDCGLITKKEQAKNLPPRVQPLPEGAVRPVLEPLEDFKESQLQAPDPSRPADPSIR